MKENIDQNSWKYKIAEQIISSYKQFKKSSENKKEQECIMSYHIFENVIIKELLWHATTMIEGYKVPRGDTKGEYTKEKAMINIKIVGQRYWTKKAMETYIANNKETNDYKIVDGLVHEHAVPRNIMKQKIIEELKSTDSYDDKCINKVFNIISKLSKSVVVTKAEDKKLDEEKLRQKMPKDWDDKDWNAKCEDWDARYKYTKIKIEYLHPEPQQVHYNKDFKNILLSKLESLN